MRDAFNNVDWITDVDGPEAKVIGVNLGFDFCAEHEWGIRGIKEAFGIPEAPTRTAYGLVARHSTLVPTDSIFFMTKSEKSCTDKCRIAALVVDDCVETNQKWYPKEEKRTEQRFLGVGKKTAGDMIFWDSKNHQDKDLKTQWAESGFAIKVRGQVNIDRLKEIHQAILANDICIGIPCNKNPFDRGGLTVLVASKIPKEFIDKQEQTDLDWFRLEDACIAAGLPDIKAKLKEKNLGWYALGPSWNTMKEKDGELVLKTAHPVVFFLNPRDQQKNHWGWVTIEDLNDWIEGKGRIPGGAGGLK